LILLAEAWAKTKLDSQDIILMARKLDIHPVFYLTNRSTRHSLRDKAARKVVSETSRLGEMHDFRA